MQEFSLRVVMQTRPVITAAGQHAQTRTWMRPPSSGVHQLLVLGRMRKSGGGESLKQYLPRVDIVIKKRPNAE